MSLLTIDEPAVPVRHPLWSARHALWALGFRPFYLLAAAFAALAIPLWVAVNLGWGPAWPSLGLGWHMHEMVFGFGLAVIIGFLFTAGGNWTGLPTPKGYHLAALAALWLAGRIALVAFPGAVAALIDLAFLPLAAWPLYSVLKRSGNKRNMFLVGLLGLLTLANALFHAASLGWLALSPVTPVHGAILIISMIEAVIGGRVIPMFTTNGVPGVKPVVVAKRDKIVIGLSALAGLAWVSGVPAIVAAPLAIAAGCATMLRVAGWKGHKTLHVALVWILHVSYAWIGIGFMLLGLAAVGLVTSSAAFHALGVGAMAGLIVGMMTRTTRGHTGRVMKAGRSEPWMYWLIQLAALLRVVAALTGGTPRNAALLVSGLCWSLSLLLFLVVYTPYLWRARIDGKEG